MHFMMFTYCNSIEHSNIYSHIYLSKHVATKVRTLAKTTIVCRKDMAVHIESFNRVQLAGAKNSNNLEGNTKAPIKKSHKAKFTM